MSCCDNSLKTVKKCVWSALVLSVVVLFPLVIIGERFFLRHQYEPETETKALFPSVTICQIFNGEKNWDLSEKYFGVDRDKRLDDFLTEIAFYTGACYTCDLCNHELKCPTDFPQLLGEFRESCHSLLNNCSWNDEPFECCDHFVPLKTEFGICYSFNSALKTPTSDKETLIKAGSIFGRIKLIAEEDVQMFIHHPFEVPSAYEKDVSLNERILWGSTRDLIIRVAGNSYEKSLEEKTTSRRHCRFFHETDSPSVYDAYSSSICKTTCYINAQMKHCGCSNHLMPMERKSMLSTPNHYKYLRNLDEMNAPTCDVDGLTCLTENFMEVTKDRKNCSCAPSCDVNGYEVIYNFNEEMGNDGGSDITVSVVDLPSEVS